MRPTVRAALAFSLATATAGLWGIPTLTGCTAGTTLVASPADYTAYRQSRVAPTLEARLTASWTYLEKFPEGSFVKPVSAYLRRAERVFYESKRGSAAGLRAYLRVLPTGPHSADATQRLSEIQARRADDEAFGRLANATEARLARASDERTAAREEAEAWIRRFVDPAAWRGALVDAPAGLIVPWSLELPVPACAAVAEGAGATKEGPVVTRKCTKVVELGYVIPVGRAPEARQITLEIVVLEDAAGRPVEVTLGGPELFARLEETYSVRPIRSDDGAGRIEAVSRAVEVVLKAFRVHVKVDAACRREVVAPTVLDLGCGGLRVTVRAGGGPDDDTIVVSRYGEGPSAGK